jgi:hypothetical protein
MEKKIFIPILIIVLMSAAGYFFLKDRIAEKVEKTTQQAVTKERSQWMEKTEELEEKVALLEKELSETEPVVDEEKLIEAFGGEAADTHGEKAETERTGPKIMNFFSYLDQKGYLKAHGIEDNASEYFKKLVEKLAKSRPVVTGETEDMYTLLKNITYFFRVLGKTDVKVIRDILKGEAEIIEPTMKLFFEWMDPWNRIKEPDMITVQPEIMYEYVSFFLNTIAGQSYLFRRDSKTRCLISYYCILVVDKSNDRALNKYGIDIRPHIDALMNDIQSHKKLAGRIDYLSRLNSIKKKY